MPTTLAIPSFTGNVQESSQLRGSAAAGAAAIQVVSVEGFTPSQSILIGAPGREGAESAVVVSIADNDTLTLSEGLKRPHNALEAVTGLRGNRIRIYRAANVDGSQPRVEAFTFLASRSVDYDSDTTFYTDPTGSADYWYGFTYFNELTLAETDLGDSVIVRGDDFGHYASLDDIRREAGFEGSQNMTDQLIDQQRRAAESEINLALGHVTTVPFEKPVPQIIETLTIQLAAGYLLEQQYGSDERDLVKSARALLVRIAGRDVSIGGEGSGSDGYTAVGSGFSDADARDGTGRKFRMSDEY